MEKVENLGRVAQVTDKVGERRQGRLTKRTSSSNTGDIALSQFIGQTKQETLTYRELTDSYQRGGECVLWWGGCGGVWVGGDG